jgi:hypothetical protein
MVTTVAKIKTNNNNIFDINPVKLAPEQVSKINTVPRSQTIIS